MSSETLQNTILIIIFVSLTIVICYTLMTIINENFQENFGSSCTDLIPYIKTPLMPIKKGQIFISIASYRDQECNRTVDTIFNNARNPENIYIGICEQNDTANDQEKCVLDSQTSGPSIKNQYIDHITYHNIPYTEANGPTKARYYCSKLWSGQQYYLQIDSHIFFEKDWDYNLINMLEKCRETSNRPVISVYPPTDEQLAMSMIPIMDNGKISANGLPVFLASIASSDKFENNEPIKTPKAIVAGGYMFLDATFLYDLPFDPVLGSLFQGEETMLSARLFTNGYDCFTPNINICCHHYNRIDGHLVFTDLPKKTECRSKAEKRVMFLLGLISANSVLEEYLKDHNQYGLGSFRTIDDFWNATGITVSVEKDGSKKLISMENWSGTNPVSDKFKGWNFNESGYEKIKKY